MVNRVWPVTEWKAFRDGVSEAKGWIRTADKPDSYGTAYVIHDSPSGTLCELILRFEQQMVELGRQDFRVCRPKLRQRDTNRSPRCALCPLPEEHHLVLQDIDYCSLGFMVQRGESRSIWYIARTRWNGNSIEWRVDWTYQIGLAYWNPWRIIQALYGLLPDDLSPDALRRFPVVLDAWDTALDGLEGRIDTSGRLIRKTNDDAPPRTW